MLHKLGVYLSGFGAVILLASVGISIRLALDWLLEGIWFDGALIFLGFVVLIGAVMMPAGLFLAHKFSPLKPSK